MSSPTEPQFVAPPPTPGAAMPQPSAWRPPLDASKATPSQMLHGDLLAQNYGYLPQPLSAKEPKRASAKAGLLVVVGLVVAALVLAGWYFAGELRPRDTPASRPLNVAPGPGTTSSLRHYLEGLNFSCTDEDVAGIVSYACLLVGDSTVDVYVAGLPDGHLGSVAASVSQGDDRSHLAIQKYLLEQFVGDPTRVTSALEKFATGSYDAYAEISFDQLQLVGAANGAVILRVDGWLPETVTSPKFAFKQSELIAALPDYSCTAQGKSQECAKTSGQLEYTVRFDTALGAPVGVLIGARGPGSSVALKAEAARVLGPLDPELSKAIADYDVASGAGYVFLPGGMVLNSYSGGAADNEAHGVYVHTSCWANQQSWC